MQRDLDALTSRRFDLLVIGGGIYGACIARDAALRGLSVALVEKQDFCSGTSHNSLKIIHSGIRYLQHLDFKRVRESIDERRIWLTIAPHLVRPLEFIVPTQGYLTRGPLALQSAILLHRALGLDWNRGLPDELRIPTGRVFGRNTLQQCIPGLPLDGLSGAASYPQPMQSRPNGETDKMKRTKSALEVITLSNVKSCRVGDSGALEELEDRAARLRGMKCSLSRSRVRKLINGPGFILHKDWMEIWWGGYEYPVDLDTVDTPLKLAHTLAHIGAKTWGGMTPSRIAALIMALNRRFGWNMWQP